METLNRRQFLTAAGISAAALGAIGLASCAPKEEGALSSTGTEAGIPQTLSLIHI